MNMSLVWLLLCLITFSLRSIFCRRQAELLPKLFCKVKVVTVSNAFRDVSDFPAGGPKQGLRRLEPRLDEILIYTFPERLPETPVDIGGRICQDGR